MSKGPTFNTITAAFASASKLNANNALTVTAFDNTVSRDGSTPNAMAADFDMDSNNIVNVNALDVETLVLDGTTVTAGELPAAVTTHDFDTRVVVAATNVDTDFNFIRTSGYTLVGDGGGALYKAVGVEPSHDLKVQSNDGQWWEIVPDLAGISVKQAGAKVDGATDDTTAFKAAALYAASKGITLIFPTGTCLLSDGFTTQTAYEVIRWVGEGRIAADNVAARGSRIKFAPSATTKYLFNGTLWSRITVNNITIEGVDPVDGGELKLFRLNVTGSSHSILDVNFVGNHHWSFYYETGCYFQNASFTNVEFGGCGTIGSAGTALIGTLLNLNNVNHEGAAIANTQKVVMDLRGVRIIAGTNLLLEGSLPTSDDWTILRIDYGAVVAGINAAQVGCSLNGFWSEWAGNVPQYSISLNGTICKLIMAAGIFGVAGHSVFLDNGSVLTVESMRFTGVSTLDYNTELAVFGDIYSKLVFRDCIFRIIKSNRNQQISYINCHNVSDDVNQKLNYELTTLDNEVLFEWNGGLLNANSVVTHPAVNSTAHLRTIITDATYGRTIIIKKNAANVPIWRIFIEVPAEWAGMTLMVEMYAHVPTVSGETFHQIVVTDHTSATVEPIVGDGTYQWYQLRIRLPSGSGGTVEYKSQTDASGSSTDFKVAALRVSLGDAHSRFPKLVKPINVRSFASAFPTTGTWIKGDVVDDDTPDAGTTMGWICTTGGTSGTWKTFGVIEA